MAEKRVKYAYEAEEFVAEVEAAGGVVSSVDYDYTNEFNPSGLSEIYWFVQYEPAPAPEDYTESEWAAMVREIPVTKELVIEDDGQVLFK